MEIIIIMISDVSPYRCYQYRMSRLPKHEGGREGGREGETERETQLHCPNEGEHRCSGMLGLTISIVKEYYHYIHMLSLYCNRCTAHVVCMCTFTSVHLYSTLLAVQLNTPPPAHWNTFRRHHFNKGHP